MPNSVSPLDTMQWVPGSSHYADCHDSSTWLASQLQQLDKETSFIQPTQSCSIVLKKKIVMHQSLQIV